MLPLWRTGTEQQPVNSLRIACPQGNKSPGSYDVRTPADTQFGSATSNRTSRSTAAFVVTYYEIIGAGR